jgi:hypothetical protein
MSPWLTSLPAAFACLHQIAALSKLSSSTIDELVRFGLLDPRERLFGFRDLASARQISNLFAHGIGLSEIIRSVKSFYIPCNK